MIEYGVDDIQFHQGSWHKILQNLTVLSEYPDYPVFSRVTFIVTRS